jgi:hypothetical protein
MRSTCGYHIRTGTASGRTPATSAQGLGSPLRSTCGYHICSRVGRTRPPATSAQEPGCGALHMYVETEPTLSAACQKGPTEGREHPAAGFGLRVLISMGLGALGAVGPLGSASGAQQARGQPAPASTHARHWRCRRGRFALRLPHWQRPWRRAVLNAPLRDNGHGTLNPSRGPGRLASSSLQVQQPTSPAAHYRAFDGPGLIAYHIECAATLPLPGTRSLEYATSRRPAQAARQVPATP